MASEGGEKPEVGHDQAPAASTKVDWTIKVLRVLAFLLTLDATLVMALNKQTKTFTVATIGTVPLRATLSAKFQHTPAFVYDLLDLTHIENFMQQKLHTLDTQWMWKHRFFVVANANATLHNLLMLAVGFAGSKLSFKGLAPLVVPVLDLVCFRFRCPHTYYLEKNVLPTKLCLDNFILRRFSILCLIINFTIYNKWNYLKIRLTYDKSKLKKINKSKFVKKLKVGSFDFLTFSSYRWTWLLSPVVQARRCSWGSWGGTGIPTRGGTKYATNSRASATVAGPPWSLRSLGCCWWS